MITNTISWPELVWTIVTLTGFFFCARVALRATLHLVSLRIRRINSIREYAAVTTVIAFASWTATQLVFVLAGVAAMVAHNHLGLTVTSYALSGLLVLGSVLLSWAAFETDRRRQAIENKIIQIEEGMSSGEVS